MKKSLMGSRQFAPLFWTQFLSAFNDNFLKNALVLVILFRMSEGSSLLVTAAGGIFILPFLLLSAMGGQIADRNDKALIARKLKLAEAGAAVVAVTGMYGQSLPLLFVALFLFGVVSALFSPIKYGLLPDQLDGEDLPAANAWVEAGTFIAILGGTLSAGILFSQDNANLAFIPLMLVLAGGCYWVSRYIPSVEAADPDLIVEKNIFLSTYGVIKDLYDDKRLFKVAMMNSWFWFAGSIVMAILPVLVKDILGGGELAVTLFLTVFAVSIGIGSMTAAWLSAGRVNLLPSIIGVGLIVVFAFDLSVGLSGISGYSQTDSLMEFVFRDGAFNVMIDFAGLAIGGAFLVVPTFTALQTWSKRENRARMIAANNAVGAGIMVFGALGLACLQAMGATVPVIMSVLAAVNVLALVVMARKSPTNLFRDLIFVIYRCFFRLEIRGVEYLQDMEEKGEVPILALNHVSYLDAAAALTLTDKAPTFAIDFNVARVWWVKPFLKLTNALPINPAKPMMTRNLIKVVESGQPMIIFPEGRLTVTGSLMKVYDGAAMVADKTGAKVVPIRIDGLEKTPFSYLDPKQIRKKLFPKLRITIEKPRKLVIDEELKGRRRRSAAGSALYEIMSELMFTTSMNEDLTIVERVIETAKDRGLGENCLEDPIQGKMSYGQLLTAVNVLGRKFVDVFGNEAHVGVMLPNANATVVGVFALMSAGKVPAMLNFTSGEKNMRSAIKATRLKSIVTSHAFVAQGKLQDLVDRLEEDVRFVFLEDLKSEIGIGLKIKGRLDRQCILVKREIDETAVILFTSGSEGRPKGVVLSHRNIIANATQAAARIDFSPTDKLFNVLPMFHSFGLTAGTVLPMMSGVPVYLYPSPLHYRLVPELVYGSNATILFGTDTFLSGYAKMAHPYDFRSLRYCFAGAEPVREATQLTYMRKFGLRVLEGYGVTEAAPVIAINTPMFNKPGTVGKLMPGMETRLEKVSGVSEGGRLFIKGPNVMRGYMLFENPGVIQAPVEGWHDTGDIVDIDEEGFVRICGRVKRFSKIAGEMVSLAAIEELAGELWPGALNAVGSIGDDRKGERLILISENEGANRSDFVKFAKARGAQDLMIPSEIRVVKKVPVLGSGKLDFAAVNEMVNSLEMM